MSTALPTASSAYGPDRPSTAATVDIATPLKYQNRFFVGRQVDFFHESHSKQISNGISLMRGILTRFFQTFVVCRLH